VLAVTGIVACAPGAALGASAAPDKIREARSILSSRASSGTPPAPMHAGGRKDVFLPSTIRVARLATPGKANATLPAFRGVGPDGVADEWYILTEASDWDVAKVLGVNFAPKLAYGRRSPGSQKVTLSGGRMTFRGTVDFGLTRVLVEGPGPSAFPPAMALPGAMGDDEWSSSVVLPSGTVVNVALVANSTGRHDRLLRLDRRASEATLELLDGWQGGDRYYYHLVTDSSDPVAATIEQGVYTPRLAKLGTFGRSRLSDRSALLAFSPNANGPTGARNPQRQGLNSTIVDGDRDPVNVFPFDPDNAKRRGNNYSPMWDAHVSEWTQGAIQAGQRRAIRSFADLTTLVRAGRVRSFAGSPGRSNAFVAGLKATGIIINCPVIAQPFEHSRKNPTSGALID
jgi:hypothetical protein